MERGGVPAKGEAPIRTQTSRARAQPEGANGARARTAAPNPDRPWAGGRPRAAPSTRPDAPATYSPPHPPAMCRFLLYQGPTIRLSSLITEPAHSLIHQSVHSKEREEPLNGDGFGLAWYAPRLESRPALFRSVTPAWNDANLNELARVVESPCVLAHVRAATQVRSVNQANCHPFTHGPYAFMHNGDVGGFHRLRRTLISELSDEAFAAIQGGTDSEHAFALLLEHLPVSDATLDQMVAGMRSTIRRLLALIERVTPGEPSYLNFALSNGSTSVVTRFTSHPGYEGESLYLHRGRRYVCEEGMCRMIEPDEHGSAVIVSSERLSEDPGWESVPPNHLVMLDGQGGAQLEPIFAQSAAAPAGSWGIAAPLRRG